MEKEVQILNDQISFFQILDLEKTKDFKKGAGRFSSTTPILDEAPLYLYTNPKVPLHEQEFTIDGTRYKRTLTKAIFKSRGKIKQRYPGLNEELVLQSLKKLLADGTGERVVMAELVGVRCTLYQIYTDLAATGHTRSYDEIKEALWTLRKAGFELEWKEANGEVCNMPENLISRLWMKGIADENEAESISEEEFLKQSKKQKLLILFHPLVTKSILAESHLMYDYLDNMGMKKAAARWAHRKLSLQYDPDQLFFIITYIEFIEKSGVHVYKKPNETMKQIKAGLKELDSSDIIKKGYDFEPIYPEKRTRGRQKMIDGIFRLYPTKAFREERRVARRRQIENKKQLQIA